VSERSAAPHPEGVLAQLFGDALGLERILAFVKRLEHAKRCFDKSAIGEHAAVAGDRRIGMDRNQGVNRILRLDLGRPAALRALAHERCGDNRPYCYVVA
jgi:hypothetical protein